MRQAVLRYIARSYRRNYPPTLYRLASSANPPASIMPGACTPAAFTRGSLPLAPAAPLEEGAASTAASAGPGVMPLVRAAPLDWPVPAAARRHKNWPTDRPKRHLVSPDLKPKVHGVSLTTVLLLDQVHAMPPAEVFSQQTRRLRSPLSAINRNMYSMIGQQT